MRILAIFQIMENGGKNMETKAKAPTATPAVKKAAAPKAKSVEQLVNEINSKPGSVKKYKEKLGYKYDAQDPNGLGNRITADDVQLLIKKKLLD